MTTANKTYLSFGRYLKRIRLENGIALEKVSEETRIGADILLLIENQEHERLPAEVFVKGFIRSYAKVIGADGSEAVRLYTESLQAHRETAKSEADLVKAGSKFWPRLLVSLGALGCVITLSVAGLSSLGGKQHMESAGRPETVVEQTDKNGSAKRKDPAGVKPPQVVSKKLLLNIHAVEKTWLKVIIDHQAPKEYTLEAGEKITLKAASNYNLLVGNAAGVELTLNGRPVKIAGQSGQVVSVQLPN